MVISEGLPLAELRAAAIKMLTAEERNVFRRRMGIAPVEQDPEGVEVLNFHRRRGTEGFCSDDVKDSILPQGFDLSGFVHACHTVEVTKR
jgi:hypothetical protein